MSAEGLPTQGAAAAEASQRQAFGGVGSDSGSAVAEESGQGESPAASRSDAAAGQPQRGRTKRTRSRTSLLANGEPMLWLTGGTLAICVAMVVGLLLLVLWQGLTTFWPREVVRVTTPDQRVYMGEVTRDEQFQPEQLALEGIPAQLRGNADAELAQNEGLLRRKLVRTGNFRLTGEHFRWVNHYEIEQRELPTWGMVLERLEWGRFYGYPEAFARFHWLEEGQLESPESRRQAVQSLLSSLPAEEGWDLVPVARRYQDGREQELLLEPSEVATAEDLVGVAAVARGPEAAWDAFREEHSEIRSRWRERRHLEKVDTGEVNHRQESARLALREREIERDRIAARQGEDSSAYQRAQEKVEEAAAKLEEVRAWADEEFARIRTEINRINGENSRYQLLLSTPGEELAPPQLTFQRLDEIVRAYPANQLGLGDKLGIYLSRWWEYLSDEPREANSEGGVFPAIFGTVVMTFVMSLAVVPFGVLAALYLREYAKPGPVVSAVRIAVNNLAGVPSIVFGVFGLGFFCYVVGASLDQLLFAASLPNPTYGKGGLLWASLTLALLTLPVVIVATEEAVAAVPNSMREGSYACGASKWQTIQRIVLPRALPGIITGLILAIARGAGEVAPLMLVGAVKLAPELPIDGLFPYVHPERSFMHLGFHIFDVGFQSQNSEAAKPMVFTTTMLLIVIVALLNFAAIWLRGRLRKKFAGGQF